MSRLGLRSGSLLLALVAGCATPQSRIISLANFPDSLRQQFNADKHKTRLLALLSPT